MKKVFTTLFLSLFMLYSNENFSQDNIIDGELLVQFRLGADIESFRSSFSQYNVETFQLLSKRMNIWLVKYNKDQINSDEILIQVKSNSKVKEAQFNHYVQLREKENLDQLFGITSERTTFPNDTRFNEQWALNNTGQSGGTIDADIDAPEAWDFTTGGLTALGDTIVVAIIDGGCDLNHQDLNYWINWAEIPNNGIDEDGNGYIDDYRGWNAYNNNGTVPSSSHGTHVSGIAGAKGNNNIGVSGVNWNVKIMPVAGSSSNEATVVAAYGYVLEMRSRYNETNGTQGAFVVSTNASFGVDFGQPSQYPLWCSIYDSLGVQGVLSCGATANLNINIDVQGDIPTACPSPWLISVTNTTRNDLRNSGAAYGLTTIDLGAPGTSILNTLPGNSYGNLTGTSMATPTVTGAIGLMFAAADSGLIQSYKQNPSNGALVFKDFLLAGTDSISSLQGITVTGGRLNVYKAILPLLGAPVPVELASLGAEIEKNSVTLKWTTASETNNRGFVVERKDGKWNMENGKWEEAGFVNGKGNTTERQSYIFNENNLKVGKYTYRLKQIDYDGSYEYSSEVEADITAPDQYTLKQNYPNPFNPMTTIEYSLPENAEIRIEIYNSLGELVKTLLNNRVEAGYQKISFDASGLPSGTYIYQIKAKGQTKSFVDSKKMLLVK